MDIDSFIVYTKTDGICVDIAKNVETRSDTSIYGLGNPLHKGKNKKVIEYMKDILGGKIVTAAFIPKTHNN